MKCILLVMARLEAGAPQDTKLTDCLKEECACWDSTDKRCPILTILFELNRIGSALQDIKNKL